MPYFSVRAKVWLERGGRVVAGGGKVRLLELIDEHGSISAAAREMGMSYRHAWGMVREMEDAAGGKLVRTSRGGSGGGNAALTPLGERVVGDYRKAAKRMTRLGICEGEADARQG